MKRWTLSAGYRVPVANSSPDANTPTYLPVDAVKICSGKI
jgi:hypothetical protein